MGNWQLTATTVICSTTGREVTITVFKDGKLACTGPGQPLAKGKGKLTCAAQDCAQIAAYQAKLAAEEAHG